MDDPDGIEGRLKRAAPRETGAALDRRIRAAIAQGAGKAAGRRAPSLRSWGLAAAAGVLLGVGAAVWTAGSAPSGLALADGSRVEAGPGARLRVLGPREVELSSGEAFFRVARRGDGARFIVRTPRGPVEVLGTSFWVTVKEESMGRRAKAGAVVSVAVVSGLVMFHYLGGDPADRARLGRLEAGNVGTSWSGGYERREAFPASASADGGRGQEDPDPAEARLSDLQREIARERATAERLAREVQGLEGAVPEGVSPGEEPRKLTFSFGVGGDPFEGFAIGSDEAADILGLDPSRATSLGRMVAEARGRFRAASDERTSIRREGDRTTIKVGAFPEEAGRILEEWRRSVSALLTPDEMARFRKYGMENGLLGSPGLRERRYDLIGFGEDLKGQEQGGNDFGEWWKETDPRTIQDRFRHLLGEGER